MSAPLASIAVLTKNGADTLPSLFEAIRGQQVNGRVEVVAVDSGSTDGTLDILERAADRIVRIPPERFNHGTTRNLALEHTRGEFVVLLVQDAVPLSSEWLATLLEPFGNDQRMAGVFARQVPRPDASVIARYYLSRWVAASHSPRVMELEHEDALQMMNPPERLHTCAFDNVCACIRRSVWMEHPFVPTVIAEDLAWARQVLMAGYRLAYNPAAAVVHSHDRPLTYELARTRDLHDRLMELFDLQTIPTGRALALAMASSAALHVRLEWRRPLQLPRAVGLAAVWPLGQYLGARAARVRRRRSAGGVAACES